jgi:hypothetical protein
MTKKFLFVFGTLTGIVLWAAVFQATLHGYCAGAGQCVDNGTNSPSTGTPTNFGFTISPGPNSGSSLRIEVLVPNIGGAPPPFTITGGTITPATASQVGGLWNSGDLASFLGISASPNNPIGAYLNSSELALNPTGTGFFVFQANLGAATLQGPGNPNSSLSGVN